MAFALSDPSHIKAIPMNNVFFFYRSYLCLMESEYLWNLMTQILHICRHQCCSYPSGGGSQTCLGAFPLLGWISVCIWWWWQLNFKSDCNKQNNQLWDIQHFPLLLARILQIFQTFCAIDKECKGHRHRHIKFFTLAIALAAAAYAVATADQQNDNKYHQLHLNIQLKQYFQSICLQLVTCPQSSYSKQWHYWPLPPLFIHHTLILWRFQVAMI